MEAKQRLLDYLREHTAITLATAASEGPHAAVVYYEPTPDLKIRFLTQRDTRKMVNLSQSPQVAFAVFNEPESSTLQGYGTASLVQDPNVLAELLKSLYEHKAKAEHGWAVPLEKRGLQALIAMEIQPKHMRLVEYGTPDNRAKVTELNF